MELRNLINKKNMNITSTINIDNSEIKSKLKQELEILKQSEFSMLMVDVIFIMNKILFIYILYKKSCFF